MPRTLFKLTIPEGRDRLPVFLTLRSAEDWTTLKPWQDDGADLPYVGWHTARHEDGRLLTVLLGPLQLMAATASAPEEASGPGTIGTA